MNVTLPVLPPSQFAVAVHLIPDVKLQTWHIRFAFGVHWQVERHGETVIVHPESGEPVDTNLNHWQQSARDALASSSENAVILIAISMTVSKDIAFFIKFPFVLKF
jgi:hypothetical protein